MSTVKTVGQILLLVLLFNNRPTFVSADHPHGHHGEHNHGEHHGNLEGHGYREDQGHLEHHDPREGHDYRECHDYREGHDYRKDHDHREEDKENIQVQQGTPIIDDFIFAIEGDKLIYANPYGSKSRVSRHPNMTVVNLGKSSLFATAAHREYFGYRIIVGSDYVQPGRAVEFTFPELYFVTYLEVQNFNSNRGFFWVTRNPLTGPDNYPTFASRALLKNLEVIEAVISRRMATNDNKHLTPSDHLQQISSIFWPINNFHFSWRKYINRMSKSQHQKTIRDLVENELIPLSTKLNALRGQIKNSEFQDIYMDLVSSLKGLESKCIFEAKDNDDNEDNFQAVALYTRIVNLRLAIYIWGTAYSKKLKISSNAVDILDADMRDMIRNAPQHIKMVSEERLENVYKTCEAHNLYDDYMSRRTELSINALDYVHYWNEILNVNNNYIENDITSYSSFVGRPTVDIYKQAYVSFGSVPFTPESVRMKNDARKRLRLKNIELFYCDNNPEDILCAGRLTFENGAVYDLGENVIKRYKSSQNIKLDKLRIRKLEVGGESRVEYLRFYLSNNRDIRFGFSNAQKITVFELENHHIASIHLSSVARNNGEIANIAVSYGLDSLDEISKRLKQKKKAVIEKRS